MGGVLQRVTLLKRDDDQRQGTVTAYTLFQCCRSRITRTGEPIAGDETVDTRCTWHIPACELRRVGVNHLNATDRIVDEVNGTGTWQPEATTNITEKMFQQYLDLECLKTNPPGV